MKRDDTDGGRITEHTDTCRAQETIPGVGAKHEHARIQERLQIDTTPEELTHEADDLVERLKEKARKAAEHAVKKRVTVSISPRGRIRRNGPCPCGSGVKFKKCCLREVQDGGKELPSPKAIRAYMKNQHPHQ